MNKLDKIISIIHTLKEEGAVMGGMTTGSTAGAPGFSSAADPKGPVAGFDPVMGLTKRLKKYLYNGKGSRSRWMNKKNK